MNIGFVSTRLAGTDGVSLEAAKMADVAASMGHTIYYCAGELDGGTPGLEAPELHFEDSLAQTLHDRAFVIREDAASLLPDLHQRAAELEQPLSRFIEQFDIDYLVIQNAFAIPMQLPLAEALANLLRKSGLPALAHNHDYYWERERFLSSEINDYLESYFPPDLPNLQHASINSFAQDELQLRRGIDSILIPNVFDFDTPPPAIDAYSADFRHRIGLGKDDWLFLQPTRVIPRKGIELSIELLNRLDDPRAKLVITHKAGDEGLAYLQRLEQLALDKNVDLRYVADVVDDRRGSGADGQKIYALWDTYAHADLIMYPSLIEGFGNALIETIYFRKPALVNRYPVYGRDIGPLGFDFVEIDGSVTDEAVARVRDWLQQPQRVAAVVEHNFALGSRHFSYTALRDAVQPLLAAAAPG